MIESCCEADGGSVGARAQRLRWKKFLNAKEIGVEESVPAAMPEDMSECGGMRKQRECEIKFAGREGVGMEGYWRYRRGQLGSWSHPGIERAAGN